MSKEDTKQIYNRFSEEYHLTYLKNIQSFQAEISIFTDEDWYYVDNYPSFGFKPDEGCDFIVYGQAPLGWGSGFSLKESVKPELVNESAQFSNKYLHDYGHTPLDWVNVLWTNGTIESFTGNDEVLKSFYVGDNPNSYRAYRSFFWNVIFKLISDYYDFDRGSMEWSKKLLWSNLCKIAPEDANPNEQEKKAQLTYGTELIRLEIEELKPKYCVVLTNDSWWEPFRVALKTQQLTIPDNFPEIQSFEEYNGTKIIVTSRPRFGNSDEFVRQILGVINHNQ
jgi:hypothetical protein